MTNPAEKVAKLRALAADKTNPHEARLAGSMADALQAKYGLQTIEAPEVAEIELGMAPMFAESICYYCAGPLDARLHTFWEHGHRLCWSCALSNPENVCSCSPDSEELERRL